MRRFTTVALALALAGCTTTATKSASPSATTVSRARTATSSSGISACGSVPAQVQDTVTAIQHGGPFVRSKDGSTYRNANRFLPAQPVGFYREYTVKTPGSSSAGARRVVTGGNPKTSPQWYFYTGNHYDTFCQIAVN